VDRDATADVSGQLWSSWVFRWRRKSALRDTDFFVFALGAFEEALCVTTGRRVLPALVEWRPNSGFHERKVVCWIG